MFTKNIIRIASLVMFMAIALPASSNSILADSTRNKSIEKTESPRAQQLLQRLKDIKAMDKSEMTRLEKKSLRKEVREIRKEMKAMSGGVYMSVGAIIIVILLLILIL